MIKNAKIIIKGGKRIGKGVLRHKKEIEAEARRFRRDVQKKIATAILAALGFVIALVWRDAIQESVDKVLKVLNITGTGYFYKILTAILVTIICVIAIMQISRWSEKEK